MKHIENLTNELAARGIDVGIEEIEVMKNSVPCTGIRIIRPDSPNICPVIYYSPSETVDMIASRIEDVLEQKSPSFDLDTINDPEYFKEHAYVSVKKHGGEAYEVVAKPYLNVDLIIKLRVVGDMHASEIGSIKVTEELVRNIGITKDEAWKYAEANTRATCQIMSMMAAIGLPEDFDDSPLQVATANNNHDGAAVLFFTEVFRNYCEENEIPSLLIIPSSTQEVICVPEDCGMSPQSLLELNESVNCTVDPILQMDPAIYRYSLIDNTITVVVSCDTQEV